MADMTFDEVLKELGISEDELKRKIAENEIRAFHEGGELKFKREDVMKLKNRLETAPTIILSDTDADSILEEPTLEEPTLEEPAVEEPTLEEPTLEEPTLEEPALEEPISEASGGEDETVLSVEGLLEDEEQIPLEEPGETVGAGVGEETVGEDTVLDSGLLEEEDLGLALEETEEEPILGEEAREGPRRVRPRPQESSPMMTGLLVVTCVLLILPGAILVNLAAGQEGIFPDWISENLTVLNDLIDTIVNLF